MDCCYCSPEFFAILTLIVLNLLFYFCSEMVASCLYVRIVEFPFSRLML